MAEAEPNWIPTAITAVSTVSAGIIGALAGYFGSARASKQAVAIAREQRRYERVHEMRAEVLPTLYADLQTIHDTLERSLKIPLGTTREGGLEPLAELGESMQQLESAGQQVNDKLEEVYEYYKVHVLWIPEEVKTPLRSALRGLGEQAMKETLVHRDLRQQVTGLVSPVRDAQSGLEDAATREESSVENLDQLSTEGEEIAEMQAQLARATAEADARKEEVLEWLRTVGENHLRAVRSAAQRVLITQA